MARPTKYRQQTEDRLRGNTIKDRQDKHIDQIDALFEDDEPDAESIEAGIAEDQKLAARAQADAQLEQAIAASAQEINLNREDSKGPNAAQTPKKPEKEPEDAAVITTLADGSVDVQTGKGDLNISKQDGQYIASADFLENPAAFDFLFQLLDAFRLGELAEQLRGQFDAEKEPKNEEELKVQEQEEAARIRAEKDEELEQDTQEALAEEGLEASIILDLSSVSILADNAYGLETIHGDIQIQPDDDGGYIVTHTPTGDQETGAVVQFGAYEKFEERYELDENQASTLRMYLDIPEETPEPTANPKSEPDVTAENERGVEANAPGLNG